MYLQRFILPWIVCIFLGFSESFAQVPSDSARNDSVQYLLNETSDVIDAPVELQSFGARYEYLLDKADRAYKFGLYKRASRFYNEAATINPGSVYIKYRLKQIEARKNNSRFVPFHFNFEKPNLLIKSLIYLISFFVGSMFIVLVLILITRNKREHYEKQVQLLREKYQGLLVDFLFSTGNVRLLTQEIAKIAASPMNRRILIDQMIDLSINLTGNAKEKLRILYFELNLDNDSVGKVYSSQWHVKVKGFHELSFMDITRANDEIFRCLHSKNEIIRMEAQLALVKLNHSDSFGFLDHLQKPFTLWEQLTVYETIMFHNLPVPKFDRWLYSKNKTVVQFALRMIDIFKQRETYPNLFWLLVNDDPELRRMAIHTIGNLKITDALHHLKRLYKNETYENCLEIIRSLAKMPDETVLNFLKLVIDKEDDVQLQIEAAMAIHNMGETGKTVLQKLLTSDYKNYQIIIKHVLDKRIN